VGNADHFLLFLPAVCRTQKEDKQAGDSDDDDDDDVFS